MATPEAKVQREIMEYLSKKKVFFYRNNTVGTFDPFTGRFRKLSRFAMKGVADIIGIYNGSFLAIEVKAPKGRLTENQELFLKKVKESGGYGFVARSVEDVKHNLSLL